MFPNTMKDTDLNVLWALLYGRHGNDGIRSGEVARWQAQLYSIIYAYGPTWACRKSIQERLRTMDDNQLREGTTAIHNNAVNPSTAPATTAFDPLPYINNQSAQGSKRSVMEGLVGQAAVLDDTLDEQFLVRFDGLFTIFGGTPTVFWTEEEQ